MENEKEGSRGYGRRSSIMVDTGGGVRVGGGVVRDFKEFSHRKLYAKN